MNSANFVVIRDGLLFVAGVLGVAHETLGDQPERPTLLILFAAMMGLPAFLSKSAPAAPDAPAAPKEDAK